MYATSLMLPCLLKLGNTNYVSLNERLLFVISAPTQFLRILQHSLNTNFYFWILSRAVCNVNKKAFQQNTYRPLADSEVQCIIGNGHMGPPNVIRQTDKTKNIIFPQLRWRAVISRKVVTFFVSKVLTSKLHRPRRRIGGGDTLKCYY